jgi:hypothetical protein
MGLGTRIVFLLNEWTISPPHDLRITQKDDCEEHFQNIIRSGDE